MKDVKKIIYAIAVLAVCLLLGQLTGMKFSEFVGNIEFNFNSLLKVIVICATVMTIKYLVKFLLSFIKKESTILTLFESLLDYTAVILCVVWSLRILGADINGVIAGLGILGLIVGMSAQDIINDLLTGIFLLLEQEYKVGDIIEVNGFTGKVTEIGVRTTVITDNGGNEKIINNSAMKNILNRSSNESMAVVDIQLPLTVDPKKVIGADYGDINCLGVEKIEEDGYVFRFTKKCDEKNIYNVRREMNLELAEILKKLKA